MRPLAVLAFGGNALLLSNQKGRKKPLKDRDDDDRHGGSGGGGTEKEVKTSTTDPESGWFHKGARVDCFGGPGMKGVNTLQAGLNWGS